MQTSLGKYAKEVHMHIKNNNILYAIVFVTDMQK